MCRMTKNDMIVKQNFKPSLRTKIKMSLLVKIVQTMSMESKWPQRTCREAVNDVIVQKNFKPFLRTKIMPYEPYEITILIFLIVT